jgi:hypothetical protein
MYPELSVSFAGFTLTEMTRILRPDQIATQGGSERHGLLCLLTPGF